jgi:prepilin-type processing-associated H-X9-DG protein
MKGKRGFVWRDLLIALAIIAILAVALSPAFREAARKSRKLTCQDNLRLIARAVQLYRTDSETLPTDFEGLEWAEQYNLTDWSKFACPAHDQHRPGRGYGYNRLLRHFPGGRDTQTILAWDGKDITHLARLDDLLVQLDIYRHSTADDRRVNLVYFDGHIKWTKKKDIKLEDFGP